MSSPMRPIVASWPMSTFFARMSIAGMVSERLSSSSMSDWQETVAAEPSAAGVATMELRNVWMPPPLEMPFVSTVAVVSGAPSTTLQPVSRFWPAPANVMPVKLDFDFLPASTLMG